MDAQAMQKALKKKKLPFVLFPAEVLTQIAESYTEEETDDMIATAIQMSKALKGHGIGLAAPQIGVSKRLIIGELKPWRFCIVNPEIVKASLGTTVFEEGCLSVPNMKLKVRRPKQITVRGFSLDWKPVKIKARGILAACLQHEIDHLNGITLANQPGS